MAHSFVIARLLPKTSAYWTSYFGLQKSEALVTRPFLALRVFGGDAGSGDPSCPKRHTALFIVSAEKPKGEYEGYYLTLASHKIKDKRSLVVQPPFRPLGYTLYIHTLPRLLENNPYAGFVARDAPPSPYQLDGSSFQTFCQYVKEDYQRKERQSHLNTIQHSSSGGSDAVADGWDTWSGESDKEYLNERPFLDYEHLPFENPPLQEPPSIHRELLQYEQLVKEYSWLGVTSAISWTAKLREYMTKHTLPHVQIATSNLIQPGNIPEVNLSDAHELHSIKIPFDGDPPPIVDASKDEVEWDWGDDPEPDFHYVQHPVDAVSAVDTRIITFDLFGTIFDRETAIREAMMLATLSDQDGSQKLVNLYIESEALICKEQPDAIYPDIARRALKNLGTRMGLFINDTVLDKCLELLLRPRLYADVTSAVKTLHDRGYTLLGFSLLDHPTFSQHFLPSVPAAIKIILPSPTSASLYKSNSALFLKLLETCQSIRAEIKPNQVVVVTAAPYRVLEGASIAGFPTVLLRRPEDLEPRVPIDTAPPTLVADGLSRLCTELGSCSSLQVTPYTQPKIWMPPFRICDSYQATKSLGFGSFGNVFLAFHLLTGEEVAIKVEMPIGKADEVCVLPYEARVYRLLSGYKGIPSVRWHGMDGGAHVLVLDKLGATLQQLRRVCRDKLSLKTVLMVAEQMLTRVEFAHSKGIILRDVKPENFAMGMDDLSDVVHLFDFGLAKLYVNPVTGKHIPFREGRVGLGTPRYASYNVHFGREQSRRDDIEALGNVLLFLLHGQLPWQGIYAPSISAKLLRIGEMKAGSPFKDLLARSPPVFTRYFDHSRKLGFEEKPDYDYLKQLFRQRMADEGWEYDGLFDWADSKMLARGTLLPEEYKFEPGDDSEQ